MLDFDQDIIAQALQSDLSVPKKNWAVVKDWLSLMALDHYTMLAVDDLRCFGCPEAKFFRARCVHAKP